MEWLKMKEMSLVTVGEGQEIRQRTKNEETERVSSRAVTPSI